MARKVLQLTKKLLATEPVRCPRWEIALKIARRAVDA
jgi:hypothetical protein